MISCDWWVMTVRTGNILLLILIPVLLGMAYVVETVMPEVTVTSITSPALKTFFAGRVVVHLSDEHLVKFGWRDRLVLQALERIQPDLIFMTGDYLEAYTDFDDLERFLARVKAVAPTLATLGNNDYCCVSELEAIFARVGIPLLKNKTAMLTNGIDSLYVVGLEDNFLWHDDYFAATAGVPEGAPRIILGHAPSIAEKIDPDGVELILSGHLHGGQILLPFYGPLARNTACNASRSYTAGLYRVNGLNLFANRGLGTSLAPLRFMARPEVAVLEFVD